MFSFPWKIRHLQRRTAICAATMVLAILLVGSAHGDIILANPGFENGATGWRIPQNLWRIEEGVGRGGSAALVYSNANPNAYTFPQCPIGVKPGEIYRYGAWAKAEAIAEGGPAPVPKISIDYADADGEWIGAEYASAVSGPDADGWVFYEGETAPVPAAAVRGNLFGFVPRGGTGHVCFDDFSIVKIGERHVDAFVTTAYGNEADSGEVTFLSTLYLDSSGPSLDTLSPAFVLTGADGVEMEVAADEFDTAHAAVTINVDSLAIGTHPVTFVLRTGGGTELGRASMSFTRGETAHRVAFDRFGRTLVEGRPFFPLGMYARDITPETFALYTNGAPWNCVMPYHPPSSEMLDVCAQADIKVVYSVKDLVFGAQNAKSPYGTSREASLAEISRLAEEAGPHPAVLAYYTNDESPPRQAEILREVHSLLHGIDPDHPVWHVVDKAYKVRPMLGAFDVIGTDPYPIGLESHDTGHSSIGEVTRSIQAAREEMFDTAPVWQVVQAFDWSWDGSWSDEFQRFPTREEISSMTWQAIANGANGIFYYAFHRICLGATQEERDEYLRRTALAAAEVREMIPVILSEPGPSVLSAPEGAVCRAWRTGPTRVAVLAANATTNSVAGEIVLDGGFPATTVSILPLGHVFASIDYTPSDIAWLTANNSSGNPTSWLGTWQIDGSQQTITDIVSTQDYGIKNKREFRPKIGTATFAGRSLSVGAIDRSSNGSLILRTGNNCDTTFAGEGLFLYAGQMQSWNAGSQTIRGKVTVRAPASDPFPVAFTASGGNLAFLCPVVGDATAGLYFHSLLSSSSTQTQTNFVCRFQSGALSNFYGEMTFCPVATNVKNNASYYTRDYNSNCKPPYFITFRTDSGTMPGTLTLYPNAIVAPESASTDFAVDSLNVVALGWSTNYLDVAISADASACSLLRVTSSLSLSTPVVVRPTIATDAATDSALDYGDLHLFAATNAAAATRLAIVKAPAGATLDASLFSLGYDDALPHLPLYELEVSTDAADSQPTLWLVRKPAVWTLNADGYQQSLYTRAAGWSDGSAPSPANDYIATKAFRTPLVTALTEQAFPGSSLSLVSNVTISACSPVQRFNDLRIFGRGVLANLGNGQASLNLIDGPTGTLVLNGRVRIDTPVATTPTKTAATIQSYPGKAWTVNAEISGAGTLYLQGGTSQSGNNNPRNGWFAILGLNTNYFGTIHVHNDAAGFNNNLRTHLLINDPRNLGAPLPSFRQNALVLDVNCALRPLASLTLEDDNRGISMAGSRTFLTVDDGLALTCKKRINYGAGVVVKDGAGELALGGVNPTFSGSSTPASGKNILDIREGTLCPVSAEAFQGLAVVITNGATLAVNVPTSNTDGGIGQYGMLDTAWDAPLTVPPSGLTVQLRDPDGVLASGPRPDYVPVCTVNATAYGALKDKLSVTGPVGSGYSSVPVWRDNGNGTHTFAATLSKGTLITLH